MDLKSNKIKLRVLLNLTLILSMNMRVDSKSLRDLTVDTWTDIYLTQVHESVVRAGEMHADVSI